MNNRFLPLLGLAWLGLHPAVAQNDLWHAARPDGHAPIHVMGDHVHHQGEWMVSYRYMLMPMEGSLAGSSPIQRTEVYQKYGAAPQSMHMDMHMLGVMYAPTDFLTLTLMGGYLSNTMDLNTRMGMPFTTRSRGWGDVSLGALLQVLNQKRQAVHINMGVSLPTGALNQRGDTPMMKNVALAYPMQLGSGTWDPFLGVTYVGQADRISWGLQPRYQFRVGRNAESYALGNQLNLVGWGAWHVARVVSLSASLSFYDERKIKGADADMKPMMMPLLHTANSGRSGLDLGVGANFYAPTGQLDNFRLGVEAKLPLVQQVEGIQMNRCALVTLGIQYIL